MSKKFPRVNIDILIIRDNKILLGLLPKNWLLDGKQSYGFPGRDINFKETIKDAVIRNIKEEINCNVKNYKVICVNENFALGNHYIGIGITATIDGEVKLLKPEDWDKWEWFDRNNIPQNLFPAAKNLIECYLANKINVAE